MALLPAAGGITGDAYLHKDVFSAGFHTASLISGALCVAGGVLAVFTIRNPARVAGASRAGRAGPLRSRRSPGGSQQHAERRRWVLPGPRRAPRAPRRAGRANHRLHDRDSSAARGHAGERGTGEPHAGQLGAGGEQLVLHHGAGRGRVDRTRTLVIEVLAGHGGRGIVADRQPGLGHRGLGHVVRGARAAHPGRHPAWLQGVAEHVGPEPGHRERQHHVEQLGVRVSLRTVPVAADPLQVSQVRLAAPVHAGAQVHQPVRPGHQRGEQVGGQDVDGEHVAEAVGGLDPVRLAVPDTRVVDHRVVPAQLVGLAGHLPHARDAGQVTHDHVRRGGQRRAGVAGPGVVAGVQGDLMPVAGEQFAGHQAEAVGRAGDQYPGHARFLSGGRAGASW